MKFGPISATKGQRQASAGLLSRQKQASPVTRGSQSVGKGNKTVDARRLKDKSEMAVREEWRLRVTGCDLGALLLQGGESW